MKKLTLLAAVLFGIGAQAQNKNEVKVNILNTIMRASVEVGYERFIDTGQSVGVEVFINDRFSYYEEKGDKKFNTSSVALSYNFYLLNEGGSGYYFSPFFKYRFGDHEEIKDGIKVTTDMNAAVVGLGVGYKWVLRDQFTISPYVNIGRNFSTEVNDRFAAVEVNAGLGIGYRF